MAKQSGRYCITGTKGSLCFYKMGGNYYVRMKSSLTGKRVKTDATFASTMFHAKIMGKASKLASCVYSALTKEAKVKGLYKLLTGIAIRQLREGRHDDEVLFYLQEYLRYNSKTHERKPIIKNNVSVVIPDFASALLEVIFAKPIYSSINDHSRKIVSADLCNYGFV